MTKAQALCGFWSGFGLPAYEENSVPGEGFPPEMPYITYQLSTDSFDHDVYLIASVWQRTESLEPLAAKVEEIEATIGRGGVTVPCDGGVLWIRKGTPFAQYSSDREDTMIKRVLLTVVVEYMTEN